MLVSKKLRPFIIALACLIIILYIFESKMRRSILFDLTSDFFKNNERVTSRIGEVKKVKLSLLGTWLGRNYAKVNLKLSGERGNMPVWAWLKKVGDEWIIYEVGIISRKGVRLNWIPMTVEMPEGAFYALKRALEEGNYEKAWHCASEWAKERNNPDFETYKKMAEDKNSLVYAIKEADIIHSLIKDSSAVLVLSTGITYIRMELVKEDGIWKVDGWMEIEKEGVKKVKI